MHAVMAAHYFVGKTLRGDRQGIGVGHFEHGRHAAHHGAARAGFEIFLLRQPRLAEMNLRVDHARKDMQPLTVDHLSRGSLRQPADRGDTAIGDGDIAHALAVLVDHGAGL